MIFGRIHKPFQIFKIIITSYSKFRCIIHIIIERFLLFILTTIQKHMYVGNHLKKNSALL
jgi:hypothetical protein